MIMGTIGMIGAHLTFFMCWSAVSWLGHLTWFLLRDGRSSAALKGMRYSAYVLIISGSGAVVCGSIAGLDRLLFAVVGAGK